MKRLLLIILVCPLICYSQQNNLKEALKQTYQNEGLQKSTGHFKLHFLNDSSIRHLHPNGIKQIMLIRHQKVDMEKELFYNYKKLEAYKAAYDTEDIYPVEEKKVLNSAGIDTVYTSKLHRSKATASALLGDNYVFEAKSFLNELKPGTVHIPLLYLPKPLWSGLNRFFWMFGSKPKTNSENRVMAQRRVNLAANFLEQKANANGKVMVIAHGYMNHLLRKRLKNKGWLIVEHSGNKNLGGSLLVKPE